MLRKLKSLLLILTTLGVYAQDGIVTGKLTDKQTGEPLVGAIVRAVGQPGGAISDTEGSYTLSVVAGTHKLTFNYIGLPEHIEENVVVTAGGTKTLDVAIGGEAAEAVKGPIVIRVTKKPNTDAAIMADRKNDVKISDGVSAQAAKATGDNDAGAMVSRAPGISVQGGKHVLVRGLGDRYTKTILNGMVIPGLDPDRNSVQMDIFPTNVLDNVKVYKTLSPDLPADFAGGLVDIATLSFPSKHTRSFSLGLGYNPNMNLNSDYMTYEGGKTDWLAFDDGTRALPISDDIDLTDKEYDPSWNNPELTELTKSFGKVLAPHRQRSFLNTSFAFSEGNRYVKDKVTLGTNLALNHTTNSNYYDRAVYRSYVKSQYTEVNELLLDRSTEGPLGSFEAAFSGLAGFSVTDNKVVNSNRFSATLFHTQNAESRAGLLRQQDYRENPYVMFRNNLEYTQRSVTNFMITGGHKRDSSGLEINWSLSPTISIIDEPDIRLTAFEYTDDIEPRYELNEGVGAVASRTYRHLFEQNYNAKLDFEKTIKLENGKETKIKFGMLETFKIRDFGIRDYRFRVQQEPKFTFSGDANEILLDENIWTPTPLGVEDSGVYVSGQPQRTNVYNAMQNIAGVYIMNELPVGLRLKAIYGLRVEQARNYYTGQNQNREVMRDSLLLNETSFLPSLNLVYALRAGATKSEGTNLRVSYNRTLARPSFKELSNAQIVDRISGRTFLGNDSLVQTDIDNIDIRLEKFMKRGQVLSASAFYKRFQNPIELVAYSAANPNDFQPRNVGTANLYGLEFEAKYMVKRFSSDSTATTVGANVTFVESSVEMTEGERLGRVSAARNGEIIGKKRDMVGASPYIVNAYVNYTNRPTGISLNLTYNVQGPRLSIVGVARNPDVYEMPFHSLNFKGSKTFGKDDQWKGSISAKNILASDRYLEYVSYGAENQLFSRLRPMRTFSVSIGYSL